MGDRSWLGFGGRARTPQPAQQSLRPDEDNEDGDRTTTIRAGDSNTQRTLQRSNTEVPLQKNAHKAPRLSRFSSLMGLNGVAKAHSPTSTSFEIAPNYPEIIHQSSELMKVRSVSYHEAAHDPSTGIWRKNPDADSEFRYRESDVTWHNPSLQQMIETVLCTIMTNGISAPIPSHLNHFVASMIEEFSFQMREMKALQNKYTKLEETRVNQAQELRETTNEWQEREREFRLEIKRLERIISDTQKGAESVLLARAGSVCNRNDRRAFRAKLNRLSGSDEDGIQQHDAPINHYRASALHITNAHTNDGVHTNEDSEKTTKPRSVLEENDLSELDKQTAGRPLDPMPGNDNYGPIDSVVTRGTNMPMQSNRNSNSTTASSASGIASSASSGIVMGQGDLAGAVHPSHVTPATTPPRVPLTEGKAGTNHVQTLRKLMLANGGLPENAIDDEESYTPSTVQLQHLRAYSFDVGDDTTKVGKDVSTGSPTAKGTVENVPLPSRKGAQAHNTQRSAKCGLDRRSSNVSVESQGQHLTTRQSSASSSVSRSPTLLFMGRNHVGRAYSNPADGRGVFIPGYSSPTRKAESGQEPFPSQETIQIARQLRTTHNTHGSGRVFFSDEELAITSEQIRISREMARRNLIRARPDAPVRFVSTELQEDQGAQAPQNQEGSDHQPAQQN